MQQANPELVVNDPGATAPSGGSILAVVIWSSWLMTLATTFGTAVAMPMVLHDLAAAESVPRFAPVVVLLALAGGSALLRFVSLPRAIARGAMRARSLRVLANLAFCWLLAWLVIGGSVLVAPAIGQLEALLLCGGLGVVLVTIEVPPRQRSRM
jgi:hypothetical protein